MEPECKKTEMQQWTIKTVCRFLISYISIFFLVEDVFQRMHFSCKLNPIISLQTTHTGWMRKHFTSHVQLCSTSHVYIEELKPVSEK